MTVNVSNKQVSSRQAYMYTLIYISDQGIVYLFVGHVNRHWGAFAKRCINNRTIRHDAKGAVPIVYCLRKMQLEGSKLHAYHCNAVPVHRQKKLYFSNTLTFHVSQWIKQNRREQLVSNPRRLRRALLLSPRLYHLCYFGDEGAGLISDI